VRIRPARSIVKRVGELPTGTVTFLFTDIEGSTRLLRSLREGYAELRDAHHRLIREAFAAVGGHEMGTEGDAFFVAFRRAKDAVTAAVAAQRALASYAWPEGAEIRVRMGIHTGEPDIDEEGYLGLTLHHVARISAAGHGGQVLLSNTTREIVEDDLPADVSLRALGEQQLKDFDHPQPIFQLVIEGLLADFPPLKTAAAGGFAARENELEASSRSITEHPWYLRRRRLLLSALVGVIAAAVSIPIFALGGGRPSSGVRAGENGLAVIDPATNDVVDSPPLALRPGDIVATPGALWVASLDSSAVLHIDPVTRKELSEVRVAVPPTGLAAGYGAVWAAGAEPAGSGTTLQRIDPGFDVAAEPIRLGGSRYGSAEESVAMGEGSVWIAPGGVDPLLRVDPRTGKLVRRISLTSCCPSSVAVGAGAAWVADRVSSQVTRIDPDTGLVKTIAVGGGPSGIAVGAGAVWVALNGEDAVSRIDPTTTAVKTTIDVGASPAAVTTGGGAIWVANSGDGTVSRIDPQTNQVVRTINVGGSPQRLVFAAGKVWVSLHQAATETAGVNGTVSFNSERGVDSLDPALAYTPIVRSSLQGASSLSWQIEYATCAKLVNYPDRSGPVGAQLVPEVAQSLPKPANGGRTYSFTIRTGFKFSPPSSQRVTAQTFKYSIERSLSKRIAGPASQGSVAPIHGLGGVLDDVMGAKAFEAGAERHISGITASGNRLTIELTAPAPDLFARLAMPFFCAVPMNTPVAPGVQVVPSAGPYYVKSFVPGQTIVLARNPNYHGPRPHNIAEIDISLGESRAHTVAQIESGGIDYSLDGVPYASAQRLDVRYGPRSAAARSGKQQYFVSPTLQSFYLALNTSRAPFSNLKLRKAVNYLIDRRSLASLLTRFGVPASANDQYLPPAMPGFRDAAVYPLGGDARTAQRLAGRARLKAVLYSCTGCQDADQILQIYLARLGIDVEVKRFPIGPLTAKLGRRGEPFDLAVDAWSVDYLDPAAYLNVLLSGKQLRPTKNFNISYFNSPMYNRKLDAAAQLTGRERYAAYGKLDIDLARNEAPMVALVNLTRQDFFSARIGCQVYNPLYGMDIAALCIRR
jgi:YVTN family beta-propeller protein